MTERRAAKKAGKEPKKNLSHEVETPNNRLDFFLSPIIAHDLEKQLVEFGTVFREGPIENRRMSGLLRGLVVKGLRHRGSPSVEEVSSARASEEREEVHVELTKREMNTVTNLSESFGYDVRSLLRALVEREWKYMPRIPFEPALEGLRGEVILVKNNRRVQRVPSFLYAKSAHVVNGYVSLRNVIHAPERDQLDDRVITEADRTRRVTVRFTEEEYAAFENLRKKFFRKVPKRSELLREMFYEHCDLKWFDLRELRDLENNNLWKAMDLQTEAEIKLRKLRKRRKRERFAMDLMLSRSLRTIEEGVVLRAGYMELGMLARDEQTIEIANDIREKWNGRPIEDYYAEVVGMELAALEKMVPKERKEWRSRRKELFFAASKLLDDAVHKLFIEPASKSNEPELAPLRQRPHCIVTLTNEHGDERVAIDDALEVTEPHA